jgi:hypothetical protein
MVPVLRGILLSLFLHFLFSWATQWITPTHLQKQTIEMTLIVREHEVPENQKSPKQNEDPRFLSARTQSVQEQIKASNSGSTQNRSSDIRKEVRKPNDTREEKNKIKQTLHTGLQIQRAPSNEALFADKGFSTVGEDLPKEIKVGSFTALNTDRFLFYSFYAELNFSIKIILKQSNPQYSYL